MRETKKCQNCQREFVIEPEDFDFYNKIKVPPPTWCPECRLIRRMMFRNERSLYKRKCDATGKDIISNYSSDKPFKVYEQKYWWSDKWDPMEYGRNYDFNKPFFEQFRILMIETPFPNLSNEKNINSEYVNYTSNSKDSYLLFCSGSIGGNEDCHYGYRLDSCKNCLDDFFLFKGELCYELLDSKNCYKVFWGRHLEECSNSVFLYNCRNCTNCFGCVSLRNKQYYIFNKPYSKEDYFEKLQELDFGKYQNLLIFKDQFRELYLKFPHKYANIVKSENILGDEVYNSKNCSLCFVVIELEDCKHCLFTRYTKDAQDGITGAKSELFYETTATIRSSNIKFNIISLDNKDIFYSCFCRSSSNLFGCVNLRHKQYCILNKQYTKSEYERLVSKIIEHMNSMPYVDKKGRVYKYGEFFPPELSPFAYNETIAQEYFPLTKEQAIEQGYSWKEPEDRDIKVDIKTEDLPDHIKDVSDDIIDKVIECANAPAKISKGNLGGQSSQCTTAFKIIEPELQFYRRMNLPLPRLCPNCRHYQRLKQRNPLKLWHRKCMCGGQTSANEVYKNTIKHFHGTEPCPNEFETTYSPERKEIVYCEKCYLAEVV